MEKADGKLELSDLGKGLPEDEKEPLPGKQPFKDVASYDGDSDSYFFKFYHPYHAGKNEMHAADGFSKQFQFHVKQQQGGPAVELTYILLKEFVQIQLSNHPDVVVELVLTPSSKANVHNSKMQGLVARVVEQLSCGNAVSLTRTKDTESLHGGGSRNPEMLADSLKLSGDTAGKCLIFLDDVVTTGSTFASIRIVLKKMAQEVAPRSVIFLAVAKTCGVKKEHMVPNDCRQHMH